MSKTSVPSEKGLQVRDRILRNPVIAKNLAMAFVVAVLNLIVILVPAFEAVQTSVLGVFNTLGALGLFLLTGKNIQDNNTTPVDPKTHRPLNPDYTMRLP